MTPQDQDICPQDQEMYHKHQTKIKILLLKTKKCTMKTKTKTKIRLLKTKTCNMKTKTKIRLLNLPQDQDIYLQDQNKDQYI